MGAGGRSLLRILKGVEMTTETMLTDDEISKTLVGAGILLVPQEITGYDIVIARAIEQAVLQSPEVQALKRDKERLTWLEAKSTVII